MLKRIKEATMQIIPVLVPFLVFVLLTVTGHSEVIEKIYAVVNGEIITYADLKNTEIEMTRAIQQQFTGLTEEQLTKKIDDMKKGLLDQIIEQKLLLSAAKEKNYDVDAELEMIIKDIKKQYNMNSDDDLKQAIHSQGLDYDEWLKQLKDTSLQHRLIREEIGYKIKIDNAQIMEYYKNNIKEYTKPQELSLDCIYLEKAQNSDLQTLSTKMQAIDTELASGNFEEIAKKYSQLPGAENNCSLGRFKHGELDAKLEAATQNLKQGEHSSWVETDSGWYIIRLQERKEPEVLEYKTVRNDIENLLIGKEQEIKIKEYLEQLKKDSLIKIYEEYK
ncbi:MAG TPA: peptidylprolyl isomerase [Candidatus Deferrimicrobium sp.]|nr:peptidylprolyl isomerase [Candidatus Deferrimicrobium sp.]